MGSPAKWIIAAKRSFTEFDVAEKSLSQYQLKDKDLKREWTLMERERNENQSQVAKRLQLFKTLVDQIKIKITENNTSNDKRAKDNLANLLEQFESRLAKFKLAMRMEFDKYENEERLLSTEVGRIETLIESILSEDINNLAIAAPSPASNKEKWNQQKQRHQEDVEHQAAIGEIDRELAVLGRIGGWDPRDHDAFLRVWNGMFGTNDVLQSQASAAENNNNNHAEEGMESPAAVLNLTTAQRQQLLKKLEFHVIGKNKDELTEHVEWYGKTLDLQARKKTLVNDWKRNQANRRKSMLEEVLVSEDLLPVGDESTPAANDMDSNNGNNSNGAQESTEKRAATKEKITQWRQAREQQKQQEKLQEEHRQVQQEEEAAEERRRRQSEARLQLDSWKKEQKNKELVENSAEQQQQQRPKSAADQERLIKQRHERDLELARQRKVKADQTNARKNEREHRLHEQAEYEGEVASRLLDSTKASQRQRMTDEELDAAEHRRQTVGAHGANVAMTGRDLKFGGHRATPSWMK